MGKAGTIWEQLRSSQMKTDVFLTMLATASSRAANLIPTFLTPKTVLVALGNVTQGFLEASFLHGAFQNRNEQKKHV